MPENNGKTASEYRQKKKDKMPVLQDFTENTCRNTRKETTGKKAGF